MTFDLLNINVKYYIEGAKIFPFAVSKGNGKLLSHIPNKSNILSARVFVVDISPEDVIEI